MNAKLMRGALVLGALGMVLASMDPADPRIAATAPPPVWVGMPRWTYLWERHRPIWLAVGGLFGVTLFLTFRLVRINRRLRDERQRAQLLNRHLERQRTHLETLVGNLPDLVWLKNPDGVYLACNPRFEELFGVPAAEIIGRTDCDFVPPVQAEQFRAQDRLAMLADGPRVNEEWVTFAVDGHRELLETTKVAMRDADGSLIGVLGIGHDITERKRIENDLRTITECAAEGIWTSTLGGRLLYANPAALDLTGHTLPELVRLTIGDLIVPEQREALLTQLAQLDQGHAIESGLWRMQRRDGANVDVDLTIQRLPDERLLAIGRDLSHLRQHREALHRAAYYDTLTGLPNRRLFVDRLEQAIARTRRDETHLAVCVFDLDGFKEINDAHGHASGDRLLERLAERLRSILRLGDTLARIGGDEFALLLVALERSDEAMHALERLRALVATPLTIGGQTLAVSASIGFTFHPEDRGDAETLLRHADQAMYRAKELGRDRLHAFDTEYDRALTTRRELLSQLRAALARAEFVLHYQPKVELADGTPVGVEALIRWQHPARGLLTPAEFIPQTEGTDLEIPLSEWVIETALAQVERWRNAGLILPVSINLPVAHLLRPDFGHWLAATLARHAPIQSGDLELEILESAAIADLDQAIRALTAVKALGVFASLDDFGTGFSSLAYFRRLPVDTLKIDQGFVRDMLDDPEALGIVENVTRLSKAFDRNVIAEGVETLEHWTVLLSLGCDQGQGYGIARPMPAAAIADWIAHWRETAVWRDLVAIAPPPGDAMLAVASANHWRWVEHLVAIIQGNATPDLALELNARHCPFGRWYHGCGARHYRTLPAFAAIGRLHDELHGLAGRLCGQLAAGDRATALASVPELLALRDALLDALATLVAQVREERRAGSQPLLAIPARMPCTDDASHRSIVESRLTE